MPFLLMIKLGILPEEEGPVVYCFVLKNNPKILTFFHLSRHVVVRLVASLNFQDRSFKQSQAR